MKITKSQLKEMVQEALGQALSKKRKVVKESDDWLSDLDFYKAKEAYEDLKEELPSGSYEYMALDDLWSEYKKAHTAATEK